MYVLNRQNFIAAVKRKNFRSIKSLAKKLNVHRNTINHYLSGKGILSDNFQKLMDILDLSPQKAFIKVSERINLPQEAIAGLIDELHKSFPELSFVLFGSHARKSAKKYSDYDVGVFKDGQISHDLFSKVLLKKNELEEDLPFFVDFINLTYAELDFLNAISRDWIFLSGKQKDWINLQRKVLHYDH